MKNAILDKRALERFDLEIPAKVKISIADREEVLDLLTSDICSGGAFFHTSRTFPEGTEVEIDLILPVEKLMRNLERLKEDYQHTCINVSGKVLRNDSKGMAIGFKKGYKFQPLKET